MTSTVESGRATTPVDHHRVRFTGGLWANRTETNRRQTLPFVYEKLEQTGRLAAWALDWSPDGGSPKPHKFWDSDIAKWMEAAAYALHQQDDDRLRSRLEEAIDRLIAGQADDGYFNSYFQTVEPEHRWRNLERDHELYCAGHLIEAAVAHHAATGERRFLDAMRRCADLIGRTFGPGPDQKRGYPGHPELELALVRLYRTTGERRHLDLARFFLTERGRAPHYYNLERAARGEPPLDVQRFDELQAHRPLLEQADADGHAVRAAYLYAGLADAAAESGDGDLLAAAKRLWTSITRRRMYLTGGIGSTRQQERFTVDFDLPEERAYCETCAAIALVFFAHRLLQIEPDRAYADVMERALLNGVLAGIGLDGRSFFYPNPLAADPALTPRLGSHYGVQRFGWFGCACCPPNVARLLASLGQYACSTDRHAAYVHLYAQSEATLRLGDGTELRLAQRTNYPWDGKVELTVEPHQPGTFTIALRIPGWCDAPTLRVAGEPWPIELDRGYVRIERHWSERTTIELELPMPVRRTEADPRVAAAGGKLAIERGPLVYCLEETDNGADLATIRLPRDARFETAYRSDLLGGCVTLTAEAVCLTPRADAGLYGSAGSVSDATPTPITAIPYALWAHRTSGEMRVWLPRA